MAAYTYVLTNRSRTLYVGMTDDLRRRVFEHKSRLYEPAFTARYRVDELVY
jgi:putative endonuclease